MSKAPTLSDIINILNSASTINSNNEAIEDAFSNTLSRDGSAPNQMEADLDLNLNDLLNVNSVNTINLYLNGNKVSELSSSPNWVGNWTTSTSYVVDNIVSEGTSSYICLEDHTSGVFATDLSNNKWALMAAGFGSGNVTVLGDLSVVGETTTAGINSTGASISNATLSGSLDISGVSNDSTVRSDLDVYSTSEVDSAISTAVTPVADKSGRNVLINGGFDVWEQKGTFGATTEYSANRWACFEGGSKGLAWSQQAFTRGQSDVPSNKKFYHRTVVSGTDATNGRITLAQYIENADTFSGKTVTISFWAKADATKDIAVSLIQNFGTGGAPSSSVTTTYVTNPTLTTSWAKHSLTLTLPTVLGKTFGSNNDDNLEIRFWYSAGSNYNASTNSLGDQTGTFDIALIQLEEGSSSTDFENKSLASENVSCLRYFQSSIYRSRFWAANVSSAQDHSIVMRVTMRSEPDITPKVTLNTNVSSSSFIYSFPDTIITNVIPTATGIVSFTATLILDSEFTIV